MSLKKWLCDKAGDAVFGKEEREQQELLKEIEAAQEVERKKREGKL